MSTITLTDMVGASANLQIRNDSPLAKAKLNQLLSTSKSLIAEFGKPLDQTDIGTVSLGARLQTPSSLVDGVPDLTVNGGVNCEVTVRLAADKALFLPDSFAPAIPIVTGQGWIGFELDVNLGAGLSAAADGFGIAVQAATKVALSTYTLFESSGQGLPLLKDALASAVEDFSIAVTPDEIRRQRAGTVNVCDSSGSVCVTGSYGVPISLSPFASANLPFNFSLSVNPSATMKVSGSLTVSGDFLVRSYKVSENLVRIGVYKKKGSILAANLTANVGIDVDANGTAVLGALLNAVLPGVDVSKTGIPTDTAKALNDVIKDSLNRSIAIALNSTCSAATTDESAVVYEVELNQGDLKQTDSALQAALKGDWTLLGTLPNAKASRNIIVETKEGKQTLSINLLGFYNATTVNDYVAKCTILQDETGQLTIVDTSEASRISAVSAPYASDSQKLRLALAQDFITTASYAAVGSRLSLSLSVAQDYLDYSSNMSPQQLRDDVRLGTVLGLIPSGAFDADLSRNAPFPHARVSLSLRYVGAGAMSIFFSNVVSRTPRTQDELERVGRKVMTGLIDPTEPINATRISFLENDAAWSAMDEDGNTANFETLPGFGALSTNELASVTVDWVGIRWWSDAICRVAPGLAQTLQVLDEITATDPTSDPNFMKQRETLAAILGAVAKDTKAAFVNTWGPAVISALSSQKPAASLDIAWDSVNRHFERAAT